MDWPFFFARKEKQTANAAAAAFAVTLKSMKPARNRQDDMAVAL
jgi:hypothetical protein